MTADLIAAKAAELAKAQAAQLGRVATAKRAVQAIQARDDLLTYIRHTMPDPQRMDDPEATLYRTTPLARVLCDAMQKIAAGELLYLCVSAPPQHGKTTVISRSLLPWYSGKFPHRHLMYGTYSQDRANEMGDVVRTLLASPEHQQVFPEYKLKTGSKSKEYMANEGGGRIAMLGRGGAGTGRTADLWVIDDPIKDAMEAESSTIREQIWQWFTRVVFTRCHAMSAIIIVMCMTGDTPVMLEDGTEKPLRDIRPGDRVATFRNGRLSSSTVKNWRSSGHDNVYKIRTSSGIAVRANERHPFLVFENGEAKWVTTKNLRQGQEIFRVNGASGRVKPARQTGATSQRSVAVTAHRTTTKNGGQMVFARHRLKTWLAGEIEGFAQCTASLKANMMVWLRRRMASVQFAGSRQERMSERTGAESFASITATKPGMFGRFFAMIATLRSDTQKQKAQPWQWQGISDFTLDKVLDVEPAGVEEVFDVQIEDTENFIANGLVSHNTRWSEDDLVGRLTDKSNPYYNEEIAKKFTYVNIPAIIDSEPMANALNCNIGDSLWPERFPVKHLETARQLNPLSFNAMYMGRPTPPEGAFFHRDQFLGYKPKDLPKELRHYLSGDLAISPERNRDKTCIGHWGLDADDTLWLLPDLYWERKASDQVVDRIIHYAKDWPIFTFFGEKGQIQKSVGPFLEKRMHEERVNFHVELFPTSGDKGARAVSFRGRMAQGKVRFPTFAPWWPKFFEIMLKFTGSGEDAEDDPADMCGLIGQGLGMQVRASGPRKQGNVLIPGTLAWVKHAAKMEREQEERAKRLKGF